MLELLFKFLLGLQGHALGVVVGLQQGVNHEGAAGLVFFGQLES